MKYRRPLIRTACVSIWVLYIGILFTGCGNTSEQPSGRPEGDAGRTNATKEVVSAIIRFELTEKELVDIRFEGEEAAAIGKALDKASPDPHPNRYVVLGTIRLKYRDGSDAQLVFFHPFGRIKFRGKYLIADLEKWRKAIVHDCELIERPLKEKVD